MNDLILLNKNRISRHLRSYSIKQRNFYHKEFQFGYTDNNDLLSGIAIWSLSSPVLFIFNATSHTYSLIDVVDEKKQPILIDLDQILDGVRENKIEVNIYILKLLNISKGQNKMPFSLVVWWSKFF